MTSTIAPTSTHSATTTAPLSGKGDLPPNEPPKHVPRQQDGPSDTSEHHDEDETVLALSGRHSELVPPLSASCGDTRMHEDELDDEESMVDFCYEESDKETKKAAQHDLAAPSVPSDADVSSHPDAEVSQKSIGRLWRFRMFCGAIVNHEYVQIGIIILIVLNALMTMIVFINSKNFLILLIIVPAIHGIGYLICMKEPRAVELLMLRGKYGYLSWNNIMGYHFGTNSYDTF